MDLSFNVVTVKQMSINRSSAAEGTTTNLLPLFLITLTRNIKSHEIFILQSRCHISIKAHAYKSQNTLTQCYNCQKFGHVWTNCKQPHCWMWWGNHLHKDCQERECCFNTNMLQLPTGRRNTTSLSCRHTRKRFKDGNPPQKSSRLQLEEYSQTLTPPLCPSQRHFQATRSKIIKHIYIRIH